MELTSSLLWRLGLGHGTLLLITFSTLHSHQIVYGGEKNPSPMFDTTSEFDFAIPRSFNKLGIFPTTIVQLEFKADEKLHLWRTNSAFVNEETLSVFHKLCDVPHSNIYSDKEGDYLHWGNCTFNDNQITALIEEGNPEWWHRNFTYIEIKTKPFIGRKDGVRHECILNEFPDRKAYIVLITNVFDEDDGKLSEPMFKLDMFLRRALEFFADIIEEDKILQFRPMEFLNQSQHYKCLVAIASGETIENVKRSCKFKCVQKKQSVDEEEKNQKTKDDTDNDMTNSSLYRDEL